MYEQTVDAYARSLRITLNRYNAGVSAKADVAAARTQLENATAQLQSLAWQRAQYEHAIAVLMGRVPSRFSLAVTPSIGTVPDIPVGLPSQLLVRRPDVAAAESRPAAANDTIGVDVTAWIPEPTLRRKSGVQGPSGAERVDQGDS